MDTSRLCWAFVADCAQQQLAAGYRFDTDLAKPRLVTYLSLPTSHSLGASKEAPGVLVKVPVRSSVVVVEGEGAIQC